MDSESDSDYTPETDCSYVSLKHNDHLYDCKSGNNVYMSNLHRGVLFVDKLPDDKIKVSAMYHDTYLPPEIVQQWVIEEDGDLDEVLNAMDAEYADVSPSFNELDHMDIERDNVDLPFRDLTWNPERKLTIYTWGRKHRKQAPKQSQHNFNATTMAERRRMISFRHDTGLNPETQKIVKSSMGYGGFMRSMIKKIEDDDLYTISINSTEGLHRSVACSEILKREFYSDAVVHHLNVK